MDFRLEHRFSASPLEVAQAMTAPEFYGELHDLPDLAPPEVLDRQTDGPATVLRVRYVFTGQVDAVVRRIVAGDEIAWVQELRVDPEDATGSLAVVPERHASLIDCRATFTLTARSAATERVFDGSLDVKVPLLGGRAERSLLPGITRRIDIEADRLETWLTAR